MSIQKGIRPKKSIVNDCFELKKEREGGFILIRSTIIYEICFCFAKLAKGTDIVLYYLSLSNRNIVLFYMIRWN